MFVVIVNAQELQINGNVISTTDQETLPGVSVVVKGTTQGTSTDFDGNYTISVDSPDAILVFSFMGMQTKEVTVGDNKTINVELSEDSALLEDVVVIGYGTQVASKVSGAVSTVNKKAVENLRPVRAEDALQGQATGVNVIGNGSPGGKPVVLIRGIPSYTGTDPLVVIDGVTLTLDDLNALNPNDIESMNVLKDAAMSAIYGVKGGNGVIVIKTKSGKRNSKTTFGFDATYGIQEVTKTIDVLNASEYAAILNEASTNAEQ
jgi:TonB-dependent SusC/RagA subfamily outer membrane receptor